MSAETPNPGSPEAREAGCHCAVLDNNHGRWAPWPAWTDYTSGEHRPEGWWVTEACPVHDPDPSPCGLGT